MAGCEAHAHCQVAMFAVTSLRRPIKCPFLMPHTSKQTNKRTDWKRLNILRMARICFGGLMKLLHLAGFTLAVGQALCHNDIHSKMVNPEWAIARLQ